MRVLKTKWFTRFARKKGSLTRLSRGAVRRAEDGLIDADLGGGVIKQRVARPGEGRSGGFRTLIAYRVGDLAVFLYGIGKNDRENIDEDEEETLKEIAAGWFKATPRIWRGRSSSDW